MKTILQRTVLNEFEMEQLVALFYQTAKKEDNFTIFFEGGLGVGKTFFVRSLLKKFGVNQAINSPTFTYVQEYMAQKKFAHFDLYRMDSNEEFFQKGFIEIAEDDSVCKLVEWPKKISTAILEEFSGTHFWIQIFHGKIENERSATITTS